MSISVSLTAKSTAADTSFVPVKRILQKSLLGLSVISSICSLIPSCRLGGALATRSITCCSASLECIDGEVQKVHLSDRLINYVNGFSALMTAQFTRTEETKAIFTAENTAEGQLNIYDNKGSCVTNLQPGEMKTFEIAYDNTFQHQSYGVAPTSNNGFIVYPKFSGAYVQAFQFSGDGAQSFMTKLDATTIISETRIIPPSVAPIDYPKLPAAVNVITISEEE